MKHPSNLFQNPKAVKCPGPMQANTLVKFSPLAKYIYKYMTIFI